MGVDFLTDYEFTMQLLQNLTPSELTVNLTPHFLHLSDDFKLTLSVFCYVSSPDGEQDVGSDSLDYCTDLLADNVVIFINS